MSNYVDFRRIAEESIAGNPTSNLYFLIDHGGLPDLCRQLSKSSVAWANLFDGTSEIGALAAAPILVAAAGGSCLQMSRALFEWMAKNGTNSSTVNILMSPLRMEVVKERLAKRLDVRLSENIDAMLRFFDPRVLESLNTILSAEQAEIFFSPVERWRYVNRVGKVVEVNSNFKSIDDFSGPLILTQQQENALLEASEVDQVLNLLRSNMPNLMSRLTLPDQYAVVSQKIDNARKIGLNSTLKFSLYTMVLLLEREDFTESPLWADFLDKLLNDDFDFSGIFSAPELSAM